MDNLGVAILQSTRPVWGETTVTGETDEATEFQSTRPVWGETAKVYKISFVP